MNIYCLKHSRFTTYDDDVTLSIYQLTKFSNGYAWRFICDVGSAVGQAMKWRELHFVKYKGELKHVTGRLYKFEPELLES